MKPEAKQIPKRPEEKQAEKESEKETEKSPSKAPIVLRSRSPARQPEDSRADSAQASKGKGKVTAGAKQFLKEWVRSEQWTWQSHCCQCPSMAGQSCLDHRDPTSSVGPRRFRLCRPVAFSR